MVNCVFPTPPSPPTITRRCSGGAESGGCSISWMALSSADRPMNNFVSIAGASPSCRPQRKAEQISYCYALTCHSGNDVVLTFHIGGLRWIDIDVTTVSLKRVAYPLRAIGLEMTQVTDLGQWHRFSNMFRLLSKGVWVCHVNKADSVVRRASLWYQCNWFVKGFNFVACLTV